MKKIKILYPQIYFDSKIIEVDQQQFDHIMNHYDDHEKAEFVWNNLTEYEQTWLSNKANNLPILATAIEMGYAKIVPFK